MGLIGGAIFLALTLAVALLVASEGNNNLARLALVIGPPMAGALIYLFGFASPEAPRARRFRLVGWFGMALGLYGLISFSFIVVPLLALTLPAVLATIQASPVARPQA